MSRSRSRTPPSSLRARRDPVADAIESVGKIVGSLERKVTKLLQRQEEQNTIIIDRLKKLEKVWKSADKSLGGLTDVIKMTHQLVAQLREHVGNDLGALKRELARVESEVDGKVERMRTAGRTEKAGG